MTLIFKWYSPIRRNGSRALRPIPFEIYAEIFEYLRPEVLGVTEYEYKACIFRVGRACKYFLSIAAERTFENVVLSCKKDDENRANAQHESICRDMVRGIDSAHTLALHVIRCSFYHWRTTEAYMANFNDSRRGMFIKACRFMVNLETLNINNVELNKEILQAVRTFPLLKNLSIASCNFDSKFKSSDIQRLGSLRLGKLSLLDTSDTLKFTYLIHAIHLSSLKELTSNSWEFIRTIASQTVDLDLETLVISQLSDTKASFLELQSALERTPNLRCLKLLFSSKFHLNTNSFSLPDTSIPNLRVLSCPASLLSSLVRIRPVNNISIVGYSQGFTSKMILAALKTSSGNISSLYVPIRVTLRSSFGDTFPQLKHLVVDCTDLCPEEYFFESVLQQLCDAHPVNNVLQTLETPFRDISFEDADPSFRDLSLQYDIITSVILPIFPNLEEFSVSKYVKWSKVPGCNEWKAKVPLAVRPEVLQYLMVYEEGEGVDWTDYDGCFGMIHTSHNRNGLMTL